MGNRWMAMAVAGLAMVSPPLSAAPQTPQAFVQRFYDWYLKHSQAGFQTALRDRTADFEPRLADALRADAQAQEKSPGDIVGLDFDPILGSQDPAAKYTADGVMRIPAGYEVNVYAITGKKRSAQPAAQVDLVESQNRWIISNIRYPDSHTNLRDVLRQLRRDREKR